MVLERSYTDMFNGEQKRSFIAFVWGRSTSEFRIKFCDELSVAP